MEIGSDGRELGSTHQSRSGGRGGRCPAHLHGRCRTPLLSVETHAEVISASVAQQRFTMMLLGCFGLISLLWGRPGFTA